MHWRTDQCGFEGSGASWTSQGVESHAHRTDSSWLSDIIAALVYLPIARLCRMLELVGFRIDGIPLSAYRNRSFYTMRTDCLDRFGNHLEHRFTRQQLFDLLTDCGFSNIVIPHDEPYWRAVAVRSPLLP